MAGTNIPSIRFGAESKGARALYHSRDEFALKLSKVIAPGYGVLRAGTILAENVSAATTGNKGLMVPYVMADPTLVTPGALLGKTMLVTGIVSGEAIVYVTMDDSYKFKVGDDLIAGYNNSSTFAYTDMGAITEIDRTTYPHMAKITATSTVSGSAYSVAAKACVFVQGAASSPYSNAKYILDQDVDTGTGSTADGAAASVLVKNAILNKGVLDELNLDTTAITSLGATADGMFLII